MNRTKILTSLCLSACLSTMPAHATSEDSHVWIAATATLPASDRIVVWAEAQARFYDDANRFGQLLIRPGIGYKLDGTTTAFVGYAFVHTDQRTARDTKEHRLWQQLSFRLLGDGRGVTVTGRSRLEQRFMAGSDDMGLRYRQQLRLTAPLAGKTRAVGWAEGFVAFDDTAWGQRAGFDRLRSFAGVAVPLGKRLSLEPGYLNEYIRLPGENRMNHIASVTVNAVF